MASNLQKLDNQKGGRVPPYRINKGINTGEKMDLGLIVTVIGCAAAVIGCIYSFRMGLKNDLRNLKIDIKDDINGHIDRLDTSMGRFQSRMDTLEERMFWIATGKKLEDAILEERMKRPRTDP